MNRKTRPVTSREYKLLLQAKRFVGKKEDILAAAAEFQTAFAQAIEASDLPKVSDSIARDQFECVRSKKQVTVQFFDTKDRRLRNSNFIFRQRQPMGGGPLELTLKRRHPDRFYASGSKTGGKTKFEEDIKATRTLDFVSLHSLSGKRKGVDSETQFNHLKDIREFFKPLKKQLGEEYDGNEKLLRVCNFTAQQSVYEGVKFLVGDDIKAESALIVWHQKDGDLLSPAVVEFSFRYHDKGLGSKQEPFTKATAKRCFDILQVLRDEASPVAKWVNLDGFSKTAYVYSLTRA